MADNVIRLSPSRSSLIDQAISAALLKQFPWASKRHSRSEILSRIMAAGNVGFFYWEVIDEFHILTGIGPKDPEFEPELDRAINGAFS